MIAAFPGPGEIGVPTPMPRPTSSAPISERGILEARLDRIVADARRQSGVTLGVVVWDLGSDVQVARNDAAPFPLGGLERLPLAVLAYRAIDNGTLHLDQVVPLVAADRVSAGPVVRAYAQGRRTFSLRELLRDMLVGDDATAADAIYRVLGGTEALNAALSALAADGIVYRVNAAGLLAEAKTGRTFSEGADNAGSPAAIAALLDAIAEKRLLAPPSRDGLLDMLSDAAVSSPLRAGLSQNAVVEGLAGSRFVAGSPMPTGIAGLAQMNGRTVIIVAMLRGGNASGADRARILSSAAEIAESATRLFPI